MKIEKAGFQVLSYPDDILKNIEESARLCYKSEERIKDKPNLIFLKGIIDNGHHAMIEMGGMIKVRLSADRGVTHEIVRHRLCSFAQESTRYCNYSKEKFGNELTFILPTGFSENLIGSWDGEIYPRFYWSREAIWFNTMQTLEIAYLSMIENGSSAQVARSVLPNSLKAEIDVQANIREWRHIFKLRCHKTSHPDMVALMSPLLKEFQKRTPLIFDNLN